MNDMTYQPLCKQCDDDGVITLATDMVEGPLGRQPACPRHFEEAGERGADLWSAPMVGLNEFCSRAAADKARSR